MIELVYNIKPIAHQSVRGGKKGFYQPKRIKEYKKAIQLLTKSQLPKGFKMYAKEVPLVMVVDFFFKKKSLSSHCAFAKVTKPDVTDNLNKALVDALAGIIFTQDQQIYRLVATKYWYKEDKIVVNISDVTKEATII
jgi:Holliday junction resolvase RusA-like endonuclease